MSGTEESGSGSTQEEDMTQQLYKCKKCDNKIFTEAEMETHKQWHREQRAERRRERERPRGRGRPRALSPGSEGTGTVVELFEKVNTPGKRGPKRKSTGRPSKKRKSRIQSTKKYDREVKVESNDGG